MKSIWKFNLETTDLQTIKMPVGAKILTIQTQYEGCCMWCLVDVNANKEDRTISIIGTGHPINSNFNGEYIGTYQVFDGSGIFHAFDMGYNYQK